VVVTKQRCGRNIRQIDRGTFCVVVAAELGISSQRKKQSKHGTGDAQMQNESWKTIEGYDHPYKVSNHGRVLGKYGVFEDGK
jgi:hypothetical protein